MFNLSFATQNEDVIILYLNVLQKVGAILVSWICLFQYFVLGCILTVELYELTEQRVFAVLWAKFVSATP